MRYFLNGFIIGLCCLAAFFAGRTYEQWQRIAPRISATATVVPESSRSILEVELKDNWHYINHRNNANTMFIPSLRVPASCKMMLFQGNRWSSFVPQPANDYQIFPES
jgi:hypothetical protein